jgi:CubicO group peptidase (beta-lactamase class C family)
MAVLMNRREFIFGCATLLISGSRLDDAIALLEDATTAGWFAAEASVSAASLEVTHGSFVLARGFGKAKGANTVFLLSSLSKPMVAAGIMILCDGGVLSLNDRVQRYLPEFTGDGRDDVVIRHLLTHTGGLPELLPEELQLLGSHAPLDDFVRATCRTPLLFKPGARVSYSNLGVLLAGEIAQRILHRPFRDFLRSELFERLEMMDTYLGLGRYKIEDTAWNQQGNLKFDPNDFYYRDLGAPWGGIHSTVSDITKFLNAFMIPQGRLLKKQTVEVMVNDQTVGLNEPWGIGWMLAHSHDFDPSLWRSTHLFSRLLPKYDAITHGAFGQHCSARTFGHYGVSGTIAWADPESNVTCVLLSTKRVGFSRDGILGPTSDMVAENFASS